MTKRCIAVSSRSMCMLNALQTIEKDQPVCWYHQKMYQGYFKPIFTTTVGKKVISR